MVVEEAVVVVVEVTLAEVEAVAMVVEAVAMVVEVDISRVVEVTADREVTVAEEDTSRVAEEDMVVDTEHHLCDNVALATPSTLGVSCLLLRLTPGNVCLKDHVPVR